jgi:hypothetical protein
MDRVAFGGPDIWNFDELKFLKETHDGLWPGAKQFESEWNGE